MSRSASSSSSEPEQELSPEPELSPDPPRVTQNLVSRKRDSGHTDLKRKRASTRLSEKPPVPTRRLPDTHAKKATKNGPSEVYDPEQPMEKRRVVQRRFRELLRNVADKEEEYMNPGSKGIVDTLLRADELSNHIQHTADATIDSRLLVNTADLAYRKSVRVTHGGMSQGVDVDEFLSKCIGFMRRGGQMANRDSASGPSATQRQARRRVQGELSDGDDAEDEDDDDEDEDGDAFNWEYLGRYACLPHIRRPGLAGFMLGPLSVETKAKRNVTARSAPFRVDGLTQTRPEVLQVEDLAKKRNDLTAMCSNILQRLKQVQAELLATAQDDPAAEHTDDGGGEGHSSSPRSTGGVDLMRFVVNPNSFSQTVENTFYVSFLIRDGMIELRTDENGLPYLLPVGEADLTQASAARQRDVKRQAVVSLDMGVWKEIIETFDIKDPLITHRTQEQNDGPGAKEWYS